MTLEHAGQEAICLGDDVPFNYDFHGWGAKIELFSPEFKYRPCLYLDLDTYILGNITKLLEIPDKLMLIKDFGNNFSNTGVMLIPENVDHIWPLLQNYPRTKDRIPPDANYIRQAPHGIIQKEYPEMVVSYKQHIERRPPAPIVCFHGKPRPHQADGWAGEVWQAYQRN